MAPTYDSYHPLSASRRSSYDTPPWAKRASSNLNSPSNGQAAENDRPGDMALTRRMSVSSQSLGGNSPDVPTHGTQTPSQQTQSNTIPAKMQPPPSPGSKPPAEPTTAVKRQPSLSFSDENPKKNRRIDDHTPTSNPASASALSALSPTVSSHVDNTTSIGVADNHSRIDDIHSVHDLVLAMTARVAAQTLHENALRRSLISEQENEERDKLIHSFPAFEDQIDNGRSSAAILGAQEALTDTETRLTKAISSFTDFVAKPTRDNENDNKHTELSRTVQEFMAKMEIKFQVQNQAHHRQLSDRDQAHQRQINDRDQLHQRHLKDIQASCDYKIEQLKGKMEGAWDSKLQISKNELADYFRSELLTQRGHADDQLEEQRRDYKALHSRTNNQRIALDRFQKDLEAVLEASASSTTRLDALELRSDMIKTCEPRLDALEAQSHKIASSATKLDAIELQLKGVESYKTRLSALEAKSIANTSCIAELDAVKVSAVAEMDMIHQKLHSHAEQLSWCTARINTLEQHSKDDENRNTQPQISDMANSSARETLLETVNAWPKKLEVLEATCKAEYTKLVSSVKHIKQDVAQLAQRQDGLIATTGAQNEEVTTESQDFQNEFDVVMTRAARDQNSPFHTLLADTASAVISAHIDKIKSDIQRVAKEAYESAQDIRRQVIALAKSVEGICIELREVCPRAEMMRTLQTRQNEFETELDLVKDLNGFYRDRLERCAALANQVTMQPAGATTQTAGTGSSSAQNGSALVAAPSTVANTPKGSHPPSSMPPIMPRPAGVPVSQNTAPQSIGVESRQTQTLGSNVQTKADAVSRRNTIAGAVTQHLYGVNRLPPAPGPMPNASNGQLVARPNTIQGQTAQLHGRNQDQRGSEVNAPLAWGRSIPFNPNVASRTWTKEELLRMAAHGVDRHVDLMMQGRVQPSAWWKSVQDRLAAIHGWQVSQQNILNPLTVWKAEVNGRLDSLRSDDSLGSQIKNLGSMMASATQNYTEMASRLNRLEDKYDRRLDRLHEKLTDVLSKMASHERSTSMPAETQMKTPASLMSAPSDNGELGLVELASSVDTLRAEMDLVKSDFETDRKILDDLQETLATASTDLSGRVLSLSSQLERIEDVRSTLFAERILIREKLNQVGKKLGLEVIDWKREVSKLIEGPRRSRSVG